MGLSTLVSISFNPNSHRGDTYGSDGWTSAHSIVCKTGTLSSGNLDLLHWTVSISVLCSKGIIFVILGSKHMWSLLLYLPRLFAVPTALKEQSERKTVPLFTRCTEIKKPRKNYFSNRKFQKRLPCSWGNKCQITLSDSLNLSKNWMRNLVF